ncbi:hypothetical protein HKX48_000028 [Thoreauomyces humboldtii]|nr:hypothetical protein HKX48_000028 [Thoreauomyces humboldtii]
MTNSLMTSLERNAADFITAHTEHRNFSGAVLLAQGDRVLFQNACGLADREWDMPNSLDTRFRIASLTKQFTAGIVMRLVEQGKLDLEATVSTYLSEDQFPASKGSVVTVHHLLSHRSGLYYPADHSKYEVYRHTTQETLKYFRDAPLAFTPGSTAEYCNSGYLLLAFLIEVVTGESYAAVLKREITDPLGLRDTFLDDNKALTKRRARGYDKKDGIWINTNHIDMSFPSGAGSIISTVGDLHRWQMGISKPGLLSKESIDAMWNVPREWDSDAKTSYKGYGLFVKLTPEGRIIEHSGSLNGFFSYMLRTQPKDSTDPSESIIAIVLANNSASAPMAIANGLKELALGNDVPLPASINRLSKVQLDLPLIAGRYQFPVFVIQITPSSDDIGVVLTAEVMNTSGVVLQTIQFGAESEELFCNIERPETKLVLDWKDGRCVALVLRVGTELRGERMVDLDQERADGES